MYIRQLSASNYRTLEDISVSFNNYYTAISGKNNAGKSNVIRAIRTIFDSGVHFRIRGNSILGVSRFMWNEEMTSWKAETKEDITLSATVEITRDDDTQIYKYLTDFIVKDSSEFGELGDLVAITFSFIKKASKEEFYVVQINGVEISDDYKKQELLKRLQSAECLTFHNSTQSLYAPFDDSIDRMADYISPSDAEDISKKKEDLLKSVRKSLKSHQQQLTTWLGKLEEKYEVSLSVQGLNFEREPIDISLKEKGGDVILDNWGSGTKNRTLIFLKLFNAVKRARQDADTDRIKPVIIIEEPESFLHPQAQSEFGTILQEMANELKIQVIVTTHSPYFLSFKSPSDNILLGRTKSKTSPCTSLVPTSGDNWAVPFVESLGIKQDDYGPMKDVIFNDNSFLLLVEGDGDKGYLEFLQSEIHGDNALRKDIEIVPVNGVDALKNTVWVSFLKKKFKTVGIMIDLDKSRDIKKGLEAIGFKEGNNLFVVGTSDNPYIEGFVPTSIVSAVASENPDLMMQLAGVNEKRKAARASFKGKMLEKIIETQCTEGLENFYSIVKKINKLYK